MKARAERALAPGSLGRLAGLLRAAPDPQAARSGSASTGLSDRGSAASGVCHRKASKPSETGDTGRQRSETYPSAVHTGSCARHAPPATSSSARGRCHRASVRSISASVRHRHPLGQRRHERRQHFAGTAELRWRRSPRAAIASAPFDMAGRFPRERFHPHQPLPRGIAEPHMGVAVRADRMRLRQPRRFEHTHGAADLMRLAQTAGGGTAVGTRPSSA